MCDLRYLPVIYFRRQLLIDCKEIEPGLEAPKAAIAMPQPTCFDDFLGRLIRERISFNRPYGHTCITLQLDVLPFHLVHHIFIVTNHLSLALDNIAFHISSDGHYRSVSDYVLNLSLSQLHAAFNIHGIQHHCIVSGFISGPIATIRLWAASNIAGLPDSSALWYPSNLLLIETLKPWFLARWGMKRLIWKMTALSSEELIEV